MTKINRVTAKIFGETALTTGNDPEIGQFGSGKAGTYIGTGDIATIQALTAWSNGWIDAVTPSQQFPALPEMTGVHKVLSQQIAYLLKEGIPEYDAGTTYEKGAVVKSINDTTVSLYSSIIDENTGNTLNNTSAWLPWGYVLKTGDMMTGDLIIYKTDDTPRFKVQTNKAVGEIPESTYNYGIFGAYDSVNNHLGGVAVMQNTQGILTTYLRSGLNNTQITVSSDGKTSCPASDVTNSIVTTTGINKSANGYVKLGNGLIIQWGFLSATSSSQPNGATVTLPTAFSNTSYRLSTCMRTTSSDGGIDFNDVGYNEKSTTSFKLRIESTTYLVGTDWIAIGY